MPKMITREAVTRAERMLAGGYTHRAVSRATGISRSTVATIGRGEHWMQRVKEGEDELEEIDVVEPRLSVVRCSGCGHLIEVRPCVICMTRRSPIGNVFHNIGAGVDLELEGADRRRYEELHAKKRTGEIR